MLNKQTIEQIKAGDIEKPVFTVMDKSTTGFFRAHSITLAHQLGLDGMKILEEIDQAGNYEDGLVVFNSYFSDYVVLV